jgi:hypothetical protein
MSADTISILDTPGTTSSGSASGTAGSGAQSGAGAATDILVSNGGVVIENGAAALAGGAALIPQGLPPATVNNAKPKGATAAQVLSALNAAGLATSGVTGAGIKIGVLSTSFNHSGGAIQDETDGALPPSGSVTVVQDGVGTGQSVTRSRPASSTSRHPVIPIPMPTRRRGCRSPAATTACR